MTLRQTSQAMSCYTNSRWVYSAILLGSPSHKSRVIRVDASNNMSQKPGHGYWLMIGPSLPGSNV